MLQLADHDGTLPYMLSLVAALSVDNPIVGLGKEVPKPRRGVFAVRAALWLWLSLRSRCVALRHGLSGSTSHNSVTQPRPCRRATPK
jgi:hypothetical protein